MSTAVVPRTAGTRRACTIPEMCVSGEGMSTVSAEVSPCAGPRLRASARSVSCECSTPFASAVVPDVYMRSAIAPASAGRGRGQVGVRERAVLGPVAHHHHVLEGGQPGTELAHQRAMVAVAVAAGD